MEVKDELTHSQHHPAVQNGAGDESCLLIEQNVSIIELDDTIDEKSELLEDGELDAVETNPIEAHKDIPELPLGEFQVVDQVGDCEGGGSEETNEHFAEKQGENGLAVSACH